MNRLSEMRSRYDDGFSSSDRLFLQEASIAILGRPVRNTSCKDCYRDAFIEIRYKLKKLGTMPKEKKFYLRAGVLLHYKGECYVNDNLTDEIAMDAINDNRGRLDLFQKTPDNLEEVLAARKAVKAQEQPVNVPKEELEKQIEGLKAVNAEQKEKLDAAEKAIAEREQENLAIRNELTETKEVLEKAKAESQAEVESLNGAIKEKDAKIAELEKALAEAKAPAAEAPAAEAPAEATEKKDAPAEAAKGKTAAKK